MCGVFLKPLNPIGKTTMAAKKGPSYGMLHSHRDKIKNSNILTCLLEHVEGVREMKIM